MYRVEWAESALNELAQLWMAADSTQRNDITWVTNEIDLLLADDPLGNSESRAGRQRVLICSPLAIFFEIDFAQDLVVIKHVLGAL